MMDRVPPSPWQELELEPADKPATYSHPVWRAVPPPRRYRTDTLEVWAAGEGTARAPHVLELTAADGRYPTLEEVRGALRDLATPGATFQFGIEYLVATEIPDAVAPLLLIQSTALPGSEAEKRLQLSGGLILLPHGAPDGRG